MKKVLLLLSAITCALTGMAQTAPNSGFETWRTSTSGAAAPVTIMAPDFWFGADSLIIADGQTYGAILLIPPSAWQRQLFQESTVANVHSGTYSAKLVTVKQDTLGIFPGIMSNASAHVTINLSPLGVGPVTYAGGTATTYHITSGSAWVKYTQGGALDSGTMTINAYSTVLGLDSLIGTGTVAIGPSTSFTQVTANVVYNGSGLPVDTVRVLFTSSAGANNAIGSTLYVDDFSMTGYPNSVPVVTANSEMVSVYPNPASDILHLETYAAQAYTCALISASGQLVTSKSFKGNGSIDIKALPAGFYFYTITDAAGKTTQKGKVNVIR